MTGDLNQKPILVSGMHRSGTTWVGKMLAASKQVAYISEPLNVWHRPGVLRVATPHWYTYICDDNQDDFLPAIQELLQFNYHTNLELKAINSLKDFGRMSRDWYVFWNGRRYSKLPLIKDPFAVFSIEWFGKSIGCSIIIIIRHPAAVASSLKKLGWDFDFRDLIDQPLLMRDLLNPFLNEIEREIESPGDLISQSCLLWRMIYKSVHEISMQFPEIIVVRHEDISLEPLAAFEQIYRKLNLEFTAEIQDEILSASSGRNPKSTSTKTVHSVNIDSRAIVKSWRKQLSHREIDRIQELTADIAPIYYTQEDWL